MGHLEVTGPINGFFKIGPMNLCSFLWGFSQCQRRIHSCTQMMGYIEFSTNEYVLTYFYIDPPVPKTFPERVGTFLDSSRPLPPNKN